MCPIHSVWGVCASAPDHLVWQRPVLCVTSSQSEESSMVYEILSWAEIIELQEYTNTWQRAGHGTSPVLLIVLCQSSPSVADS